MATSAHPSGDAIVREATAADCPAVAEIYRHYVDNTVATFAYVAPGVEAWEHKLDAIVSAGRPFLVALDPADATVTGFAYLGPFRTFDGPSAYDRTVEDTIYLRPGTGGRGIGSALMAALIAAADPATVRRIVAVIAATGGEASVALHEKFGFTIVGRTPHIGFKHDQWIDTIYLQRDIGEP